MAVFEQFPYTNFHELNLDWLLNNVKALQEKWENVDPDQLERELKNYIDEQIAILAQLRHEHQYTKIEYYVDGVNGSNVTGDGSAAHPYYTIAKALDMMDATGAGCVIKILSGGTYTITRPVLTACSVDFIAMASSVRIQWLADSTSTYSKQALDTRVTFTGYHDGTTVLAFIGAADTFIDGSVFDVQDCEIVMDGDTRLRIVNGFANIQDCNVDGGIMVKSSVLNIGGGRLLSAQRTSPIPAIQLTDGSILNVNNTVNQNFADPDLTTCMIQSEDSTMYMIGGPDAISPTFDVIHGNNSALYCRNNTMLQRWTRCNVWDGMTINGRYFGSMPTYPLGLSYADGAPILIQAAASYSTAYNVGGSSHVGIRCNMTNAGTTANNFVEVYKLGNGATNNHVVAGVTGTMLYRLNTQFTAAGTFRVVSCTAYDLSNNGSASTSQNADVTFDIYIIP